MLSDVSNELARARENLTLGWNLLPTFPEFSEDVAQVGPQSLVSVNVN